MRRSTARGRVFPQSYSTDRRYGRLSLKACALFPLIWVNADDQGRLCGDPEEVKYACCPNIDHITKADIPQILQELEQNRLIKSYGTANSVAIQLLDWWSVQKPQWAWPSEYQPSEGWHDRLRYKNGARTVVTENWPSGESRTDTHVDTEQASADGQNGSQVREDNSSGESPNSIRVSTNVPGRISLEPSGENRNDAQVSAVPHPSADLSHESETEKETERGNRNRISPESSGENQKGAQVSTQVAKKPPDPFIEKRGTIFARLKEKRGYNSPQAGAEAKAVTWMLKQGYSVQQILGAYDKLKQSEFWRDKLLNMQSVKAQIGEIFREKSKHGQQESEGRGTPVNQRDPLQAFRDGGGTVILSGEEAETGNKDRGV